MQRKRSAGDYFRRAQQGGASGGFDFDVDGDLGDLFGNIFHQRSRRQPAKRKGDDIDYAVEVTLEEAANGTVRMLSMQVPEACAVCSGTGRIAGATCHTCQGLGSIIETKRLEVKSQPVFRRARAFESAAKVSRAATGAPMATCFLS